MAECTVDQRPTDTRLCHGCLDHLKAELRAVPWLVRQLTVTLTRQARVGERNGPRSAEIPLPYHAGASSDLESLRDVLRFYADAVAGQRGVAVDAANEPVGLSRWLLRWSGEVAQFEAADELHAGILSITRSCRRTIDRFPDKHFLGPCDRCGHDLYAYMHDTISECRGCPGSSRCKLDHGDELQECDAVYDVAPRRAWLFEQAVDQLRTASQLAAELPWIAGVSVTRERIGMWARRGKLTVYAPHVRDERGVARFRVGEVVELARSMAVDRQRRAAGAA